MTNIPDFTEAEHKHVSSGATAANLKDDDYFGPLMV